MIDVLELETVEETRWRERQQRQRRLKALARAAEPTDVTEAVDDLLNSLVGYNYAAYQAEWRRRFGRRAVDDDLLVTVSGELYTMPVSNLSLPAFWTHLNELIRLLRAYAAAECAEEAAAVWRLAALHQYPLLLGGDSDNPY